MYYAFSELPNSNKHEDFYCTLSILKHCDQHIALSNMFSVLYTLTDDVGVFFRKVVPVHNNIGLYYDEYLVAIECLDNLGIEYSNEMEQD